MRLILEKKTKDSAAESTKYSNVKSIQNELGRMNRIDSKYIEFITRSDQNLHRFFKSFIGPGDEVLTVGPTNDNICRAITSCHASYLEFYEKPLFLPDSLGIVGKVTRHTRLIFLGNPNRYTGVLYSKKEIEDILNISKDIIVVLDESSYESSRVTAIDLIKKFDNLALVRLFENGKNGHIEYIISGSTNADTEKIDEGSSGLKYSNMEISEILYNLKNPGNRLGRIKDARQEMLYLSIRLRMLGFGCFLNPDYSLVIDSNDSDEIILLLNKIGVQGLNLANYPGLQGNILLAFRLDIKAMPIIDLFETMAKNKKHNILGHNRLSIYQPLDLDNKFEAGSGQKTVFEGKMESNIIF